MPANRKSAIRQNAKRRRQQLSAAKARSASAAIVQAGIKAVDWGQIKRLHVFLPIRQLSEVDTWPLVKFMQRHHPGIAVYTAIPPLQLNPDSTVKNDPSGVPQPAGTRPLPPGSPIDLILVPLLAFDQRGHRVGYGRGCYDRFLAEFPAAQKIGLSYRFGYVAEEIEAEAHDVALDMVITEEGVFRFG